MSFCAGETADQPGVYSAEAQIRFFSCFLHCWAVLSQPGPLPRGNKRSQRKSCSVSKEVSFGGESITNGGGTTALPAHGIRKRLGSRSAPCDRSLSLV